MVLPSAELFPINSYCVFLHLHPHPARLSVLLKKWKQTFLNLLVFCRNNLLSLLFSWIPFMYWNFILGLQFPLSSNSWLYLVLLIFPCVVAPVIPKEHFTLWPHVDPLEARSWFNLHVTSAPCGSWWKTISVCELNRICMWALEAEWKLIDVLFFKPFSF